MVWFCAYDEIFGYSWNSVVGVRSMREIEKCILEHASITTNNIFVSIKWLSDMVALNCCTNWTIIICSSNTT